MDLPDPVVEGSMLAVSNGTRRETVDIITRTSDYESFTMSDTGYI
jgi:hypothetical protein